MEKTYNIHYTIVFQVEAETKGHARQKFEDYLEDRVLLSEDTHKHLHISDMAIDEILEDGE